MDYAFASCSSLSSIDFPESITKIGAYAFKKCSSFETISLPEGVTEIAKNTFDGCTGLKSATVHDGITKIGSSAFNGCTALEDIYLGSGLQTMDSYVFYGCKAINNVESYALTAPKGSSNCFESAVYKNAVLKILPSASGYDIESPWSAFENVAKDLSGIEAVGAESVVRTVDVYNLSGVKLRRGVNQAEALDGLPSGLYICGGHKVYVK